MASRQSGNANRQLSMKLSGILRHGKDGFKRHIDSSGWLEIALLIRESHFCQSNNVSYDQISSIVSKDNKNRFKISDDGLKIKANQGHTIAIQDASLEKITLEKAHTYSAVVHGTYMKALKPIMQNGLSKMRRTHIHFTASDRVDASIGVVSGYSNNCDLLIYLDICKAVRDGIEFFVSENNVILCSGNAQGYLDSKYFSKIIDGKTGNDVIMTGQEISIG